MVEKTGTFDDLKSILGPAIEEYLSRDTDVEDGIRIMKGMYEQYRDNPLMSIPIAYVLSELCIRVK